MLRSIVAAAALAASGSAVAQAPAAAPPTQASAIDPARLALGNQIATVIWPDGSYATVMQQMMGGEDGLFSMLLEMKPSELVGEEVLKAENKGELPPEAGRTLREALRERDPHFEERMKITMKVMGEEMGRAFKPLEPRMRAGLGKAFARRFSEQHLREVAAFFATPAGRTYAGESLMMFMDKDVMTEIVSAMPEMMKSMPQMMERIEKATAHLPPPPKPGEQADDEEVGSAEETPTT